MPLRRACAVLAFASLVAATAGCKTEMLITCDPACAPGFACDTSTGMCVGGGEMPDLAAPPSGDIAMGCTPACAAPTPFCNKNRQCVSCLADTDCPNGTVCKTSNLGASCVPGCVDDTRCGNGQKCCNAQCVDTSKDANHCGACGKPCVANHARPTCVAGACKAGNCDPGWGDCNMDGSDGCETNLRIDPANCTACGMKCAIKNAVAGCADGCYLKACNFGYDDCNADAKDGCETSVLSDAKNCGACGKNCTAPPHAKAQCLNATCAVTSCDVGWTDCDNDGLNGCETNTGTDAKNCGACGNACPQGLVCQNGGCTCPQCNFPNAMSSCVNNMCVMGACLAGYADCDKNPANGCEVNIFTDKNNCGACGNVCPMNMPGCNMGMCSMGCLNGMQPPPACTNGKDPGTGDDYTVCTSDCTKAWMASTKQGGGKYHIQAICQSYGYSKYGQFGGTCGNICGYCTQGTSCMAPQMGTRFDGGGMNCGSDMLGPILCFTVQWECLK